jgi:hypothetical protein
MYFDAADDLTVTRRQQRGSWNSTPSFVIWIIHESVARERRCKFTVTVCTAAEGEKSAENTEYMIKMTVMPSPMPSPPSQPCEQAYNSAGLAVQGLRMSTYQDTPRQHQLVRGCLKCSAIQLPCDASQSQNGPFPSWTTESTLGENNKTDNK